MAKSANHDLEWLIIFLVYNNDYYDRITNDEFYKNDSNDGYNTMWEQTKHIRNQIKYSQYNRKVQTILVEVEIANGNNDKPLATISMLAKEESRWLPAVDRIWRIEDSRDMLTNSKSLSRILEKVKNYYPSAKRHMIITAGHGSIVGINYYIPNLQHQSATKTNTANNVLKPAKNTDNKILFKEIDDTTPLKNGELLFFLTNREISEAFKHVFRTKKVDVLVMYNCLMQNIFTQYEFKETVDWLVAPVAGISTPGFNYKTVLNEISKTPTIDAETISKLFVDPNTIRKGNYYKKHKKEIEESWKLAAIKLDNTSCKLIQEKLDTLFSAIIVHDSSKYAIRCLYDLTRHLFNYAHYCWNTIDVLDIGIFLGYFKAKITSEYVNLSSLIQPIEELLTALKKHTNHQHVFQGKSFYNNGTLHKEDDPILNTSIVDVGFLFPFRKLKSEFLGLIYSDSSYPTSKPPNRDKVPSFLKNKNYAIVINKLQKLSTN